MMEKSSEAGIGPRPVASLPKWASKVPRAREVIAGSLSVSGYSLMRKAAHSCATPLTTAPPPSVLRRGCGGFAVVGGLAGDRQCSR